VPYFIHQPISKVEIELRQPKRTALSEFRRAFVKFKRKPTHSDKGKKNRQGSRSPHGHDNENDWTNDHRHNQVQPEVTKWIQRRMKILKQTQK